MASIQVCSLSSHPVFSQVSTALANPPCIPLPSCCRNSSGRDRIWRSHRSPHTPPRSHDTMQCFQQFLNPVSPSASYKPLWNDERKYSPLATEFVLEGGGDRAGLTGGRHRKFGSPALGLGPELPGGGLSWAEGFFLSPAPPFNSEKRRGRQLLWFPCGNRFVGGSCMRVKR